MRILIGNHIDPSIRTRGDMRAWTQRIFWFARDGDLIVLLDHADQAFVRYATALTGVDPSTLRIHVLPEGGYAHLLDPATLANPGFLVGVASDLRDVTGIFALWPSAHVAHFATALGLADRLPGAAFLAQGGGELVNNKVYFRALAAGCGAPIAAGAVCRTADEAVGAMTGLIGGSGAVVVKQAHNGAGVGNEIVIRSGTLQAGHAGARHLYQLDPGPGGIEAYWSRRWDWASANGRFPVVVEEFQPQAVSVYSEHHVDDTGTRPTETGTLIYVDRRLSHQIVPLRDLNDASRDQLVGGGTQLAEAYRAVGYRGYLSADAVLAEDGRVTFTEVNAQVSGSLHIYDVIAHQIVRTGEAPKRSVVEYHVPPHWGVADFDHFIGALRELGCDYEPATRIGVIVSMPVIPLQQNLAQFLFCIVYDTDDRRLAIYQQLDQRFATHAAAGSTGPEHIGIAAAPRA